MRCTVEYLIPVRSSICSVTQAFGTQPEDLTYPIGVAVRDELPVNQVVAGLGRLTHFPSRTACCVPIRTFSPSCSR